MPLASFLCPFDVVLDSVVWAEVRPWPHFPLSWDHLGTIQASKIDTDDDTDDDTNDDTDDDTDDGGRRNRRPLPDLVLEASQNEKKNPRTLLEVCGT